MFVTNYTSTVDNFKKIIWGGCACGLENEKARIGIIIFCEVQKVSHVNEILVT